MPINEFSVEYLNYYMISKSYEEFIRTVQHFGRIRLTDWHAILTYPQDQRKPFIHIINRLTVVC
jgi:hypothetical protein